MRNIVSLFGRPCLRSSQRNSLDLHLETIRFLLFPASFFFKSGRRPGERMREEQKQANERVDLDVEIGRRGIVRAAPDRKASQSAHSASFSPFPSAICSPVFFFPSVSSSSKGLRVVSVDLLYKRCKKTLHADDVRVEIKSL